MTLAAVIFGITLSTLHQSGLGALFLMAKEKIHPLWYSEFIPIMFLVSSVFAGLSMVIFEGSISHKVFFDQISEKNHRAQKGIISGLSKICAGAMFAYLFLQILVFIHGKRWDLPGYTHGLLVSDRDIRFCTHPDAAVLLQLPEAKYPDDQNSRNSDNARCNPEQA